MIEKKDSTWFRGLIGLVALFGALGGFYGLFFIEVPVGNRDAMMLALGLVMGWAGAVVASEYGSTSTGRKIADSAVRQSERLAVAAANAALPTEAPPTGKAGDPIHATLDTPEVER